MARTYTFDLIQDGMTVASASSADPQQAVREIWHYAMMYAQDGQVSIKARDKRSFGMLKQYGPRSNPRSAKTV